MRVKGVWGFVWVRNECKRVKKIMLDRIVNILYNVYKLRIKESEVIKMLVLKDDKFEYAIRKRLNNMHADFAYYAKYNTGPEHGSQWHYVNPLNKIWDLRINLRFEYVNKKIDEKYEAEIRRLTIL